MFNKPIKVQQYKVDFGALSVLKFNSQTCLFTRMCGNVKLREKECENYREKSKESEKKEGKKEIRQCPLTQHEEQCKDS